MLLLFVLGPLAVVAQQPNRVALVVALEDGLTLHRCVAFEEEEISSFEALKRSGLVVESGTGSLATAVCRVEETGCPGNDCFCQCKGGNECRYWSYWHWLEGEWVYAQAGAASYLVKDGDVEGWTWGLGSVEGAIAPPTVTFAEICLADNTPQVGLTPAATADLPSISPAASPEQPASVSWFGYGVFGLLVLGLGWLLLQRATDSEKSKMNQ